MAKTKVPPRLAFKVVTGVERFLEKFKNKLLPPQVTLVNMTATNLLTSRSIYIAAELGLADLLKGRAMSVADMAKMTDVHANSLYRVMRLLVSIGIFAERKDNRFELTALGEYLQTDIPGSMRSWVRYMGAEWHWNLWGKVLDSVKNGKSAYENVYGERFFEWLSKNPEPRRIFDEGMISLSDMANPPIALGYDFSSIGTLVDIAGGYGSLLATILRINTSMKGILFDLPKVIEKAKKDKLWDGLAHRCYFVSGSFFESIPAGADAYIMKFIVHDWDDQEAIQILKNCHRVMGKNKKVLLAELVIPAGNELFPGKFLDLGMLTLTGGRERTEVEYRELFESAGFKLRRIIPTVSPYSIIEGIRL